jgi:site-specific DNA-methyltransferase (adenine-specific)
VIELYTYPGDLVLDPFMGSGSSAVAAVRTGRHYLGYDTDADYVTAAQARVAAEPAVEGAGSQGGASAREVAAAALADAGFEDVTGKFRSPVGTDFALRAQDAGGRTWFVDVPGGFTTGPSGLRRTELLWRAVGMAHTVRAAVPECRTMVLTPALPGNGGKTVVRHLVESGTPVLELADPELLGQLKALLEQ